VTTVVSGTGAAGSIQLIFRAHEMFDSEFLALYSRGWLGSRVVSVLDSGAEGPGLKSQSRRCRVTVLGELFTPTEPLFTKHKVTTYLGTPNRDTIKKSKLPS